MLLAHPTRHSSGTPSPPAYQSRPHHFSQLSHSQSQHQHQPFVQTTPRLQLSTNNNSDSHTAPSSHNEWNSPSYTINSATPSRFDFDNKNDYVFPFIAQQANHNLIASPQLQLANNQKNLRVNIANHFPHLMQAENNGTPDWQYASQLTPAYALQSKHQRESSISSVGSPGPATPYSDAGYDGLPSSDFNPYNTYNNTYPPKALPTPASTPLKDSFLAPAFQHYNPQADSESNLLAVIAMQKALQQQSADEAAMPAPELIRGSSFTSVNGPSSSQEETDDPRLKNGYGRKPPRFDRTMSDAYNDELYSPAFSLTPVPSVKSAAERSSASPSQSDVFSQRLQAANNQHLSAPVDTTQTSTARDRSPFRQGSPLAPVANNNFSSHATGPMRIGSAAQMREQRKAENDARALKEQIQRTSPAQNAPDTISPKDALLDYHETEEDAKMPLFPRSPGLQKTASQEMAQSDIDDNSSQQSYGSMATSRRESGSNFSAATSSQTTPQQTPGFTFVPPAVPGSIQVPQQYPFISQSRRQTSNASNATDRTPDFPSTLTSMDSSCSEFGTEAGEIKKPANTTADGGTYTCTYHGCTLRFETPAKLQKHKREGHRQSAPLTGSGNNSSDGGSGMTSAVAMRNTQAGPHKCDRVNPSTGKPCNTIFSRPYDLTRHEDTIHNSRKHKVRCEYCQEEKTFSRNDALTRHMRVVHPEIDFPAGKPRRRNQD